MLSFEGVQNMYLGNHQITEVWLGNNKVRPDTPPVPSTEYIEYVMTADNSGNLYVPIAGYSTSGNQNCVYDWQVSVDGGTATSYAGTGSSGGKITLTGYTSGQDYTIRIKPTSEGYLWARAYGWRNTTGRTYLKSVTYDGSYMGYAQSATATGNYFKNRQYEGCTNLTSAPAEVLPNTVTDIGSYFRGSQYQSSGLTEAPYEVIPSSVTSIGGYFRYRQYYSSTSLATIHDEVMPNSIISMGQYFRDGQYYGCRSLSSSANEVLSSGVTYIGANFRHSQYQNCTGLTSLGAFAGNSTATTIENDYRSYQFYGCTSLVNITQSEEVMSGVTTILNNFRLSQFSSCTSLVSALGETSSWTALRTVGNYYKGRQYEDCTSLQGTGGEDTNGSITTIGSYFRAYQFANCKSLIRATMAANRVGGVYYREGQFYGAGQSNDQIKIIMVGNVVDANGNNCDFTVNYVLEMIITDSSLLSSYQNYSGWSDLSSKMTTL